MARRTVWLFFFINGLIWAQFVPVQQIGGNADIVSNRTEVKVVSSDVNGVVVDFVSGGISLTDARDGKMIKMAGAESHAQPGEPYLPGLEVLVGVAQSGNVRLSFSTEGFEEFSLVKIAPAPGFEQVEPAEVYAQDGFWPKQPAELKGLEVVRGIRVARIRLNPVQFNPVRRLLRVHKQIRVTLEFSQSAKPAIKPDPLDQVLARMLVNGNDAINWKIQEPEFDSINFFSRFGVWCKVRTETTGVYQIKPADLKDAGFELSTIDPRTFRLFTIGRYKSNGPYPDTMIEVPIYVAGEDDSKFDSKDYIIFYAQSPSYWNDSLTRWEENYYTRYRVFWLTWGSGLGKRLETISGAGAVAPRNRAQNRVRIEEDLQCPARGGLLWVCDRYSSSVGNEVFYRPFILPKRDTLKNLKVRFYGRSEKSSEYYQAVLILNGVILDTVRIEAKSREVQPQTFVFESLPQAVNRSATSDTLAVIPLGPADIYLDYIEVDYIERLELSSAEPSIEFSSLGQTDFALKGVDNSTILLDITDPFVPKRIVDFNLTGQELQFRYPGSGLRRFCCSKTTGFRKVISLEVRNPGNLRHPTEDADYYIVSPDEFLPAARLLARYREGNLAGITNPRVTAVPLSAIYDDYTFGMEEPGAIKAFFAAKEPAYGLLLGDATYDYKDNLRVNPPPGVPAYEIGFDLDYEVYNPIVRALDAWFADFEGGGSSPDMILGRVTCRTPYEVRQFLDKVRRYETQEVGLWAKRFLLLGDDEYLGSPDKEEGLFHIRDGCEMIAALGQGLLDISKVYLTEYPRDGTSKPKANAELLRQLNAGALLWCFFGHGAGFQLCHERAFHIEDVPRVNNGGRLPLAFYGSCGVGRFEDTRYQAIAEEVVRVNDGCIAALGASKATYSSSNENFARTFFSSLISHSDLPIGPAFYQAWFQSYLYILFGDPGTKLRLPQPDSHLVVISDTFYPGGLVNWQANSQLAQGYFALRAAEADRERFYQSFESITYTIPGQEIFRMSGRFTSNPITGQFVFPRLDYPDTVIVGNGWYARKRNSCRISGIFFKGEAQYAVFSKPLYLSTELAAQKDSQPPEVTLFADNTRLKINDTARVPKRFNLRGQVSDPAGILLVSDPTYGLSFYLGERTRRIELNDYFLYEGNSAVSGSFSYPVELEHQDDSLAIIASDNYLNRLFRVYHLQTELREELRLDSCFVYPNPVAERAWFTFRLTGSALVTVKVFTITGRLVRVLGPKQCGFGYNQIEWDAGDKDGNPLANGVYLYKIDARTNESSSGTIQSRSVSYRDRLIIKR